MPSQNHVGSVPSVDYHNYDYDSHHAQPFGPGNGHGDDDEDDNGNGRHSPIDKYCDEPEPHKDMPLGYGTESIKKSRKKHRDSVKAKLAAIGQALEQDTKSHAKAEQASVGQASTGQAGTGQANAVQGRAVQGRAG